MRVFVCVLVVGLLATTAGATSQLLLDKTGSLWQFSSTVNLSGETTISAARSPDRSYNFGPASPLLLISREVDYFQAAITGNGNILVVYSTSGEVFFRDRTTPNPVCLSTGGEQPTLAEDQGQITAAWIVSTSETGSREKGLQLVDSADGGQSFGNRRLFLITGETLSSPKLAIDRLAHHQLLFLSENSVSGNKKIIFSPAASFEPVVIAQTSYSVASPEINTTSWGLQLSWLETILGQNKQNIVVSLDWGQHFSRPQALINPKPLSLVTAADFELPPQPVIINTGQQIITNQPTPEISYQLNSPNPQFIKIDLSWEKDFPLDKSWSFEQFVIPAKEVTFRFPTTISDGRYFLRLAAFDGLATSPYTPPLPFIIDRVSPEVVITSPTSESLTHREIILTGQVSHESAQLSLNGRPVTLEAGHTFNIPLTLKSGQNLISLVATDEAGNITTVTKEFTYLADRPEITVVKPKSNDWLRPGSTLLISATLWDPQGKTADETEAEIIVDTKKLAETLSFDQDSGELTGFIKLPDTMAEGKHPALIRLTDPTGKTAEAAFEINIDITPPEVGQAAGSLAFCPASQEVRLPVNDTGAGVDLSGTLVRIAGLTLEGTASLETTTLIVKTKFPLKDGTYEVEITPRDVVGNTGPKVGYTLVVDSIPPGLVITNTTEADPARDKLVIEGLASDNYQQTTVTVYNNNKLVTSTAPLTGRFSLTLPLVPGRNQIEIKASDQAGNSTSFCTELVTSWTAVSALINSFSNGPNPFSPKNDGQMYFVYSLSSAANLKLYLFDPVGTLLYQKSLTSITSGNITWNGTDQFNQPVANGLYPYLAEVSAGSQREIKRGKVIVLQ